MLSVEIVLDKLAMQDFKHCEACGSMLELTKHHVYPRALRDIWTHQVSQRFVVLCRICHDVVHLRGGLAAARKCKARQVYIQRFCDPNTRETIGYYRAVIRHLERLSREKHQRAK